MAFNFNKPATTAGTTGTGFGIAAGNTANPSPFGANANTLNTGSTFGGTGTGTTSIAFGGNNTSGTAGGFGSNPASNTGLGGNTTTSGFSFGANTAANTNTGGFGTTNTGIGFGATNTGATTNTGFGATNSAFGNNNPSTGFGASGFGSNQTTNAFGATTANAFGSTANKPNLFGSVGNQATTGFGSMNQGGLGGIGQPQQLPSTIMEATQGVIVINGQQIQIQPQVADYIRYLGVCWDTQQAGCQFKHYFFNLVHPSEVSFYKPDPSEDPILYEQAQLDNPDPTCMVPVLAVGFNGLKTRLTMQEEQLKTHKEKLEEFQARLEKLNKSHTVESSVKIESYQRKQRQIVHHIFRLMKSVQILRNRGYSLRAEEEALISRLMSMDRDLNKPSVFRGRLNEIWAHIQQLKEADRLSGSVGNSRAFLVSDERELQPLVKTLDGIGKGLSQLTNVVKENEETISNITKGYEELSLRLR